LVVAGPQKGLVEDTTHSGVLEKADEFVIKMRARLTRTNI
jgi:hypothetical protein